MPTATGPNVLTGNMPEFEGFLPVRTATMLLQINDLLMPYVLRSIAFGNVGVALQYNAEISLEMVQ
ncbi:MAG: hypothetical protein JF606_18440 [Burkholderiales bacterium]|jgi:hypothetical protein|nr:hypothetical protein [Burkholderiales bacterium]